jgi:Fe-S-cluster containining protein
MKVIPFYTSGLRFSCKKCSTCCRHETGHVFLSKNDLKKLTTELNIDKKSFINTYCRWAARWSGLQDTEYLSLKEKVNFDCIFWNNGCIVYNARPLQCRTYPFWDTIVSSVHNWDTIAADCPGINSGRVHNMDEIKGYLKMRTSEPLINRQEKL